MARGETTRAAILEAARESLREHGYQATSTRAVAERAGVRLSQVHYHFGGKPGLLIAVLEHENATLLERQHALFDGPEPLSRKWRIACDYLRDDLASGYVRILWELWAAGLADEELARRWRAAADGWRSLLEDVLEQWSIDHGIALPAEPRQIVTLVSAVFWGVEVEILAGLEAVPHFEALELVGTLIERAEARAREA